MSRTRDFLVLWYNPGTSFAFRPHLCWLGGQCLWLWAVCQSKGQILPPTGKRVWKNATGNCCNRPGLNNTISKLNSHVLPSWFAAMVLVKKDSHLSNISMRAWQNYRRPIEKYTKSPRLWRQQARCAYWPGDLTRAEALFFWGETEAEWNSKIFQVSSWIQLVRFGICCISMSFWMQRKFWWLVWPLWGLGCIHPCNLGNF